MEIETIINRLNKLEDILRPAACFLGGMELGHRSKSINCTLLPAHDAYNSIIRAGVELHDLRHLLNREDGVEQIDKD